MKNDCCLFCEERSFLCHSVCGKHKARKERDAKEQEARRVDRLCFDYNNETAYKLANMTRHSSHKHKGMVHVDPSITAHPNNDLDIEYEVD